MARTSRPVVSPGRQVDRLQRHRAQLRPGEGVDGSLDRRARRTAKPRRLTSTKEAESGAAWSPDSQADRVHARSVTGDQADQIYVIERRRRRGAPHHDDRDRRVRTEVASGRQGDAVREPGQAGRRRADKSTARVFDAMPIRFWNAWLDGSKPHIFVQELDGGAAADWLAGTKLAATRGFDGVFTGDGATRALQPAWSPDGQEIVFVAATNRDVMMREEVPSRLFRVKKGQEPRARSRAGGDGFARSRVFARRHASWSRSIDEGPRRAAQPYTLTRLARFDWPSAGRAEGADRRARSQRRQLHDRRRQRLGALRRAGQRLHAALPRARSPAARRGACST